MKKIHFSQRLIFIIWIFLELIAERMYGKYFEFDLNFRNLQSVTPISLSLSHPSIFINWFSNCTDSWEDLTMYHQKLLN